jgi:hypothetical protein
VNGYEKKFIDQMYQHRLKMKQLHELTTLTPVSDEQTIKRVAASRKNGPFNQRQTLGTLGNPKDQVETLQKSGIYQIDCLGCSAF